MPVRVAYAIGCAGIGFKGMVTSEARKCNWLSGMPLYAWGFLKAMVKHFKTPTMRIRFDDSEVVVPTLALSVLNGQREGNFPLRPDAILNDGVFDYMHATRLSRWHLIRYLPAMATGRLPENHPLLAQPNCFITPHLAGGHVDETKTLVRHFLRNFGKFTRGEPLSDRIM